MAGLDLVHHLLAALGIGLMVGAERERRKVARATPADAGLRTFAVAALFGASAMALGGAALLGVALACTTALAIAGYLGSRDPRDPGLTTELALVVTTLLGGLAITAPLLAGSAAAVLTIVLAARDPLHRLVGELATAGEVADVLLLAGAALVVLPLLPDGPVGPFGALNPHAIGLVVVMILAINAAGHLASRLLGVRLGVPVLGLASGFVSSSATIAAMGAWARATPAALLPAAAAAVLSTVATFVQLGLVIAATDHATLATTLAPLAAATLVAVLAGGLLVARGWRAAVAPPPALGRGFSLMMALGFATLLSVMLVAVAGLQAWFGQLGVVGAAAVAGLLDVHAAAIAVATLVADGKLDAAGAVLPMLAAWTSSAAAKIVFSATVGPRGFGLRVVPAQLAIIGAAWAIAFARGLG